MFSVCILSESGAKIEGQFEKYEPLTGLLTQTVVAVRCERDLNSSRSFVIKSFNSTTVIV